MRIAACVPGHAPHVGFLQDCIDTLNRQTRPPDVISISLSSWSAPYPPAYHSDIPVLLHVTSATQNAATNRNVAAAAVADNVDVLSFIDIDDLSCPTRIAEVEAAVNAGADVFVHNFTPVSRNAQLSDITEWPTPPPSIVTNPCFKMNAYWACGYIYLSPARDDIHNAHNSVRSICWKAIQCPEEQRYNCYEDSEYNYRLFNAGYKFMYSPNKLSFYRTL